MFTLGLSQKVQAEQRQRKQYVIKTMFSGKNIKKNNKKEYFLLVGAQKDRSEFALHESI